MGYVNERVAYLKGLCEGMELADSKEAKLLKGIIDVLEDIADELTATGETVFEISEEVEDVAEAVDELDEAVEEISDIIDEEIFGYAYDNEDCDADCEHCDDEDCTFFPCPVCKELIDIEELEVTDDVATCPACQKEFTVKLENCDCEDCEQE